MCNNQTQQCALLLHGLSVLLLSDWYSVLHAVWLQDGSGRPAVQLASAEVLQEAHQPPRKKQRTSEHEQAAEQPAAGAPAAAPAAGAPAGDDEAPAVHGMQPSTPGGIAEQQAAAGEPDHTAHNHIAAGAAAAGTPEGNVSASKVGATGLPGATQGSSSLTRSAGAAPADRAAVSPARQASDSLAELAAPGDAAVTATRQPGWSAAHRQDRTTVAGAAPAPSDISAAWNAVELAVLALIEQLDPETQYSSYNYLSNTLLGSAASYSLLQLQVLHQLLAWLLQLPPGDSKARLLNAMSCAGCHHIQCMVECWTAEVQQSGCQVEQAAAAAPERYAVAYDASPSAAARGIGSEAAAGGTQAAAGARSVEGYLAGLCQLTLNLLWACCQAAGDDGDCDCLQNIAAGLGKRIASLLVHGRPYVHPEHCKQAGFLRNFLFFHLKAVSSGRISVMQVEEQVLSFKP